MERINRRDYLPPPPPGTPVLSRSRHDVPIAETTMSRPPCPHCGMPKHPLLACPGCGYSRRAEQTREYMAPPSATTLQKRQTTEKALPLLVKIYGNLLSTESNSLKSVVVNTAIALRKLNIDDIDIIPPSVWKGAYYANMDLYEGMDDEHTVHETSHDTIREWVASTTGLREDSEQTD